MAEERESFQGRRLPDTQDGKFPISYYELLPGDYWKILGEDGTPLLVEHHPTNLTKTAWSVVAPARGYTDFRRNVMIGNLRSHTVREEEDGTISVRAGDGSSNSILIQRGANEIWHGYIEHGVWTSM